MEGCVTFVFSDFPSLISSVYYIIPSILVRVIHQLCTWVAFHCNLAFKCFSHVCKPFFSAWYGLVIYTTAAELNGTTTYIYTRSDIHHLMYVHQDCCFCSRLHFIVLPCSTFLTHPYIYSWDYFLRGILTNCTNPWLQKNEHEVALQPVQAVWLLHHSLLLFAVLKADVPNFVLV